MPEIRKVAEVRGLRILLRDAREEDAAFILSLRTDPRKARFLSPVEDDVARQREWIREYQASVGQAYFVVCGLDGEPLGTVRLYDAQGDSFSWGSWVLKEGAPMFAALESALLVYRLGLQWGFRAAHFQVHKANASVVAFHERMGAVRTGENDEEVFLRIDEPAIRASLARHAKHLPA
jgi:RimJ/RimL family protein N-acetyltransferase